MSTIVEAIYENGVLRPVQPIPQLTEGQQIRLIIEFNGAQQGATTGVEGASPEAQILRRLEAQGLVEHPSVPQESLPAHFRAIQISGIPLSQTILQERG